MVQTGGRGAGKKPKLLFSCKMKMGGRLWEGEYWEAKVSPVVPLEREYKQELPQALQWRTSEPGSATAWLNPAPASFWREQDSGPQTFSCPQQFDTRDNCIPILPSVWTSLTSLYAEEATNIPDEKGTPPCPKEQPKHLQRGSPDLNFPLQSWHWSILPQHCWSKKI